MNQTKQLTKHLAGTVTFGGVDKNRFTGPMFKVPITPYDQAPEKTVRFWARVQSVGHQAPGQNETKVDFGAPYQDFLLDSGTTLTFLPPAVVAAVRTQIGGVGQPNGDVSVNCSWVDSPPDGGLVFHFANGSIAMPYRDIVLDLRPLDGGHGPGCFLGVSETVGVPGKQSLPVLGSEFLLWLPRGLAP
jgi:Eukaryotic aspartyl protease